MEFVAIDEDTTFEETSFGVLEPVDGTVIPAEEIDLMVVPGVAFTTTGKRLGFGGGYYDRYLANYQGATISLALNTQVAAEDEWEADPFDIRVNKVLTPSGD